ncbi:TPA: hypothetical protein QDE31_01695 [Burkholderia cenocepacia]|nr:hypothetical protein [Burkholderia cenocepacia]
MKAARAVFIPIPLYGGEVVLCRTREEWSAVAAKFGIPASSSAGTFGITHELQCEDGRRISLIGVFDGAIPTLAHELLHSAIATLAHVGIPINRETDEALTYLFEHLLAAALPLFLTAQIARKGKGRG